MVTDDGRDRCIGCRQLTQVDRLDGKTVLHWSTARTTCERQVPYLGGGRWWPL